VLTDPSGRVRVDASLEALRNAGKLAADQDQADASESGRESADKSVVELAKRYAESSGQKGAIMATLRAQARWPAIAALAALDEGVSVEVAQRLYDTIRAHTSEDATELLAELGVTAFRDGDPPVWGHEEYQPNWDAVSPCG
jgi:hypothetical protein